MSSDPGDDADAALPAAAGESTQKTAAFVDGPDNPDPWSEPTPSEDDQEILEADAWVEADVPSFVDPIPVDDLDVTPSFAPVPSVPLDVPGEFDAPLPSEALAGDLQDAPAALDRVHNAAKDMADDLTRAIAAYPPPSDFSALEIERDVTPSFAPTPSLDDLEDDEEPYTGDGPFAAPIDRRPATSVASFVREIKKGPPEPQGHRLDNAIMMQRRPVKGAKTAKARPVSKRATPPSAAPRPKTKRHYPKMRALLRNPDAVPVGSDAPPEPHVPVVPGTFFPAPRPPIATPAPADLDGLLATMAEGLLIGETADGHAEVRVTLKDEFFAGTELRITMGEGALTALLVPPDREVYWQLSANIDELRERLTGRGLRVQDIRVADP